MTTMDCGSLRDAGCELALNLLTGAERAAAMAHLESCQECRAEVSSLAATADELLELAVPVEPPAGFESKVLRSIATEQTAPGPDNVLVPRRRPSPHLRRRAVAGLLVAAAVVALLAVLGVVVRPDRGPTAAATMRTLSGADVGTARVQRDVGTVTVEMQGWTSLLRDYPAAGTAGATLHVRHRDGTREVLALGEHGGSSWRRTWSIDGSPGANEVTAVAIVGPAGQVWCSARFA
jgi:hypothetical protein